MGVGFEIEYGCVWEILSGDAGQWSLFAAVAVRGGIFGSDAFGRGCAADDCSGEGGVCGGEGLEAGGYGVVAMSRAAGSRRQVQRRTWKIDAVGLDASLHEPDLGVAYESTGATDAAALRTEATATSVFPRRIPIFALIFTGCGRVPREGWQADAGDGTADGGDPVRAGNRE